MPMHFAMFQCMVLHMILMDSAVGLAMTPGHSLPVTDTGAGRLSRHGAGLPVRWAPSRRAALSFRAAPGHTHGRPDPENRPMAMMGRLAASFAMTDPVWERHANPWSGATRIPVLPLLALSVYARVWIGAWCLVPLALLVVWAWANPRIFAPPARTRHWMSRAVLGERVWLNAEAVAIPPHHARAAAWLSALAGLGLLPLAWGLWVLDPWATVAGCTVVVLAKLWFLDRMVWLHADMAALHPPYAAWLR